ncbi:hypothetical protein DENSPDRAFT_774750 [Dentipellis sp. KUC8613]|nr:hypothetical protein DENSPDRAFT_774750 [Dentipellis sp. KUC8613]
MAAVSGPIAPRHPSPFRKAQKISRQPTAHQGAPTSSSDPYHGHEDIAKLCSRFVSHLFACPDNPPAASPSAPTPRLDHFIAYALHRTRLHSSVTFAALYLLQRLKARFPAAKGSSGHRLFISAFMIASKIICDDTYSNKSWCIVGQGMFALREINQMEREMCSYLEWQLNVDAATLADFEAQVRRDFAGNGPYPPVALGQAAPTSFPHAGASAPIPSFGPSTSSRTSPPRTVHPSILPASATAGVAYTPAPVSPPDTPSSSRSTSSSPASTASPSTPPDMQPNYDVKIVSSASSENISLSSDVVLAHAPSIPIAAKRTASPAAAAPQKAKLGRDQFAFATRTVW